MAELKQIEIISSKANPSPQFLAATSSSLERQVGTIVSTSAQMNSIFVGSGLLSAQFLADSSVPTLPNTKSLGEVSPNDVFIITEIRRIIEPRDRSIDSSSTDRTEPKAQLRELDLMSCSALETISSAEVFPHPESSLDAIASVFRAIDIPRAHSYLDINSSTANPSVRRTLYYNASQPQGVVRIESAPGSLNTTGQNAIKALIHIRTLSYLDEYALDNGLLEANPIASVSSAAVPVSNSTSRRLKSVPLASFGPIPPTEVLRQPQSSLGLIASAKELHQQLSSLDTASLKNNHTAPFLTTPSWAAASTLTEVTSTTTCSVYPLSVAFTAVSAKHLGKTEGKALETASSPSARLRRMWRFSRHLSSRKPSHDRQRCVFSRPESSQPPWLLRYLVRRSRIFRCCPLRQQIFEQHRPPLSPRPMRAKLKRAIPATYFSYLKFRYFGFSYLDLYYLNFRNPVFFIPNSTHSLAISRNSSQSGQLLRLLSALKIRTLPIHKHLSKRLIKPHLKLNTSSLAFNKLRIHNASLTAPISSNVLGTVSGRILMQFVNLRVLISSESAGPFR